MHPKLSSTCQTLLRPGRSLIDLSASPNPNSVHESILYGPDCAHHVNGVLFSLDEFLHIAGCDDHEMTVVRLPGPLVGVGLYGQLQPAARLIDQLKDVRLLGAHFVSWSPNEDTSIYDMATFANVAQSVGLLPLLRRITPQLPAFLRRLQELGVVLSQLLVRIDAATLVHPNTMKTGLGGLVTDVPWEVDGSGAILLPNLSGEPQVDELPNVFCLVHQVPADFHTDPSLVVST